MNITQHISESTTGIGQILAALPKVTLPISKSTTKTGIEQALESTTGIGQILAALPKVTLPISKSTTKTGIEQALESTTGIGQILATLPKVALPISKSMTKTGIQQRLADFPKVVPPSTAFHQKNLQAMAAVHMRRAPASITICVSIRVIEGRIKD